MLREKLRLAVRYALITVLNEEVEAAVGAQRYERNKQRRDHRNGTYTRSLGTSQETAKPELRAIFYQQSREKADQEVAAFCEKYEQVYPTAAECLKRDLDACLAFYAFPLAHWRTIRTTNVVERLFGEVKKRSHKMAAAFRNEGSCLLMCYAVIRSLTFKKLQMPAQEPEPALLHRT